MKATRLTDVFPGGPSGEGAPPLSEGLARACVAAAMDLPANAMDPEDWLEAVALCVVQVWSAGAGLGTSNSASGPLDVATDGLRAYAAVVERSADSGKVWWITAEHDPSRNPGSASAPASSPSASDPRSTSDQLLAGVLALPLGGGGQSISGVPGTSSSLRSPGLTSPSVAGLVLWTPLPTAGEPHWLAAILQGQGVLAELAMNAGHASTPATALRAIIPALHRSYERSVLKPQRMRDALLSRLTGPQSEVARLLVQGLTEAEIGKAVHRSKHTIHDHVKSVYAALNVSSRTELLRAWYGLDETGARRVADAQP